MFSGNTIAANNHTRQVIFPAGADHVRDYGI
jgi:hypothetical protein